MIRKRPLLFSISCIVIATTAGLALLQKTRHRTRAMACATTQPEVAPPRTAAAGAVAIRMDYAGAEALINALGRDSLSDADIDTLLRVRGLCAMVDNVPRFFPAIGVSEFRRDIRSFVRTRNAGPYDGYFHLSGVWQARAQLRATIAAIRANERTMMADAISQLAPYRPDTGALAVTAYFVAGGVSDGFAFENDPTSFYANLARAGSDLNAIVLNMAHEAYHVMQFRAQSHAGVISLSASADTTPPVERLFATTLSEGTATYVVDPTRSTAIGPGVDSARRRYLRNAEPKRIAENFARFDTVLKALTQRRMTWERAYAVGFTSENDASFYFVGYEMTRAIERYCGRDCIGRLFTAPAVEFFRRYVSLSHEHPELLGHFSRETESSIATDEATPGRR